MPKGNRLLRHDNNPLRMKRTYVLECGKIYSLRRNMADSIIELHKKKCDMCAIMKESDMKHKSVNYHIGEQSVGRTYKLIEELKK